MGFVHVVMKTWGKSRDFAELKFNLGFSLGSLATDIYQLHYT